MTTPDLIADLERDEGESWRAIPGEAFYEASTHGRIRSLPRVICGRSMSGRVLKCCPRWRGDALVCLVVNLSKGRTRKAHRLVLQTFVGPAPAGAHGRHNDGDAGNNRLPNLRWDTPKANHADSVRHGTAASPPIRLGEMHHKTTITVRDVLAIRAAPLRSGVLGDLAGQYNLSTKTIWRIRHRQTWAHIGEDVAA